MVEFTGIYTKEERQAKIDKEKKKYDKALKNIADEAKKITLNRLFAEAAFMAVTLEETRMLIIRDGVVDQYKNGANQFGLKKSACIEVYDKTVNTYLKTVDQINKTLPESVSVDPSEDLLKFAFGGKK